MSFPRDLKTFMCCGVVSECWRVERELCEACPTPRTFYPCFREQSRRRGVGYWRKGSREGRWSFYLFTRAAPFLFTPFLLFLSHSLASTFLSSCLSFTQPLIRQFTSTLSFISSKAMILESPPLVNVTPLAHIHEGLTSQLYLLSTRRALEGIGEIPS